MRGPGYPKQSGIREAMLMLPADTLGKFAAQSGTGSKRRLISDALDCKRRTNLDGSLTPRRNLRS